MKRLLLLLLSCVLLLGVFAGLLSCQKEDAPQNENLHLDVQLVSEGKARYSIVYPDQASEKFFNRVTAFANAIYRVTGVKMDVVKNSWIDKAANDRYIYIGKDSCDQAAEAAQTRRVYHSKLMLRAGVVSKIKLLKRHITHL